MYRLAVESVLKHLYLFKVEAHSKSICISMLICIAIFYCVVVLNIRAHLARWAASLRVLEEGSNSDNSGL